MIREQSRVEEAFYWWDQKPFELSTYDSLSDYERGVRFRWTVKYMTQAIVKNESVTRYRLASEDGGGIIDASDELVRDVLKTAILQNRPNQDFIGPELPN